MEKARANGPIQFSLERLVLSVNLSLARMALVAQIIGTCYMIWIGYSNASSQQTVKATIDFIVAALLIGAGIVCYLLVRNRLQTPLSTQSDDGKSLDAFKNPRWETVSGLTFTDTLVKVDSKRFYNCTFNNITFEFAGTGPTEMISCHSNGHLSVETEHPVARAYSHLWELLNSFPGGKVQVRSYDEHDIPRPSLLRVSEVAQAEKPSLAQNTFALCKELRVFIKEIGPKPELPEGTTEAKLQFVFDTVVPWQDRLNARYEEQFKNRVIDIRYKLKEQNLSDEKLNNAIAAVEKKDDESLRVIDRGLRCLAAQLED
jgi:hypothetical protein